MSQAKQPSIIICALSTLLAFSNAGETRVSISGEDFLINGAKTYPGQSWKGHRIEGLLMNSRMVQATFDDLNPETVKRWAYPDTGKWDANRNTREFIAAMPEWKAHGLLAFTINLQGGSPEGYSKNQPWENSAFSPDGTLRTAFMDRTRQVLDAADKLGMVVILGYFYFGQDQRFTTEAAIVKATDNATQWLLDGGWTNVLVEVNNETNVKYDHEILKPGRIVELIRRVRSAKKGERRLMAGTSYGGGRIPDAEVVAESDFVLLHGNGVTDPSKITRMVAETRALSGYTPKPILFNEDDHEGFERETNNLTSSVAAHASWGWFDFRRKGEPQNEGYQSPPVDWGIGSTRKKAFFGKLREITGGLR
ncbi:MAG: hypothetical protein JNJ83_03035 [Verrucomicrobiaceae bacterium]|nr:hypothetical protein [Verrucomicrobiaceae bacterium]